MRIYYSRSNEVEDGVYNPLLQDFIMELPEQLRKHVLLTKYDRNGGGYDPELLEKADLVIVGIKEYEKNLAYYDIAKGCASEIEKASKLDIPVLLLHTGKHDDQKVMMLQSITYDNVTIRDHTNWQIGYADLSVYSSLEECIDEDIPACELEGPAVGDIIFDIYTESEVKRLMNGGSIHTDRNSKILPKLTLKDLKPGDRLKILKADENHYLHPSTIGLVGKLSSIMDDNSLCIYVYASGDSSACEGFNAIFIKDLSCVEKMPNDTVLTGLKADDWRNDPSSDIFVGCDDSVTITNHQVSDESDMNEDLLLLG